VPFTTEVRTSASDERPSATSASAAILLVEQYAIASLKIAHRAYALESGKIALSGAAKDLLNDPRVREVYLGL
jgi:branched-chain amino acid transport system ATP-binding protein